MDTPAWWREQGELPGVLLWAIVGLQRLQQQDGFTRSTVCDAAIAEYRAESNPARLFLAERFQFVPDSFTRCDEVYDPYREWCKTNGYLPLASNTFGKEVGRLFPAVARREKQAAGERFMAYFGLTAR